MQAETSAARLVITIHTVRWPKSDATQLFIHPTRTRTQHKIEFVKIKQKRGNMNVERAQAAHIVSSVLVSTRFQQHAHRLRTVVHRGVTERRASMLRTPSFSPPSASVPKTRIRIHLQRGILHKPRSHAPRTTSLVSLFACASSIKRSATTLFDIAASMSGVTWGVKGR
jgi:hypothetical protein